MASQVSRSIGCFEAMYIRCIGNFVVVRTLKSTCKIRGLYTGANRMCAQISLLLRIQIFAGVTFQGEKYIIHIRPGGRGDLPEDVSH